MKIIAPTPKAVAYLTRLLYTRIIPPETIALIEHQLAAGMSAYRCREWIVLLKDKPWKPRPQDGPRDV